jgi:hypothetical protein
VDSEGACSPRPGAGAGALHANRAFAALVKLLTTCADTEHAKRITAQVTRTLRVSWGAATAAEGAGAEACAVAVGQGPALLARLVRVVHHEVFPRQLARRWAGCWPVSLLLCIRAA